jgi:hypothetical protein
VQAVGQERNTSNQIWGRHSDVIEASRLPGCLCRSSWTTKHLKVRTTRSIETSGPHGQRSGAVFQTTGIPGMSYHIAGVGRACGPTNTGAHKTNAKSHRITVRALHTTSGGILTYSARTRTKYKIQRNCFVLTLCIFALTLQNVAMYRYLMCCRFIYAPPHCLLSSLRGSSSLPSQSLTTNAEDFILLELMCGASAATWRRSVVRTKRTLNISMLCACLDKTDTEVLEGKWNSTNETVQMKQYEWPNRNKEIKKEIRNKWTMRYAPDPNPRLFTPQLRTLTSTPLRRTCVKSGGLHMNTSTDAKPLRRFSLRFLNRVTVPLGHCSGSGILRQNKSATNRRGFARGLCHLVRINRNTTRVLPPRGGLWNEQTTPSQSDM